MYKHEAFLNINARYLHLTGAFPVICVVFFLFDQALTEVAKSQLQYMARGRPRKYKTKKDAALAKASSTERFGTLGFIVDIYGRSHQRTRLQKQFKGHLQRLIDKVAEEHDTSNKMHFLPHRPNAEELPKIRSILWWYHSESEIDLPQEDRWTKLQEKMNIYRSIIRDSALDMVYFGKKLQYSAQRFCSRHMDWPLVHQCGALYVHCDFSRITNRFGHALLTMQFDIPGVTEADCLFLPPKWTYGSFTSFKETFCSLPAMASERTAFIDCVSQWLNGLLEQMEKDPNRSLYLEFQRARIASSFAQREEQPVLKELTRLKREVKHYNWERWGEDSLSWKDRSTLNDVGPEDYRDYFIEPGLSLDNYIIQWE
jgi:hypothetical protein